MSSICTATHGTMELAVKGSCSKVSGMNSLVLSKTVLFWLTMKMLSTPPRRMESLQLTEPILTKESLGKHQIDLRIVGTIMRIGWQLFLTL